MARRDASGPVTLSVLDRLIDKDPKNSSEIPLTRAQSLRELKLALKRDLEWLLNTRQTIDPAPESARETVRSVYQYGFADISSKSVLSSARPQRTGAGDGIGDCDLRAAVEAGAKVRMEQVEGGYRSFEIRD